MLGATIYLHIGMPKTGSTSIQHTLFENREKLLEWGANYLALGRNHAGILLPFFSENPHTHPHNLRRGINTPSKARVRNKEVSERLLEELHANRVAKIVISGEAFLTARPQIVRRLKEAFSPFAEEWRVIVYVRDPYQYVNSALLQRIKGGAVLENSFEAVETVPLPHYQAIQHYVEVFGRDRVDIRIFDKERFVGGDLLSDFLDAIGCSPHVRGQLKEVRINGSLSHEAALILSEINATVPVLIDRRPNPVRSSNIRFLLEEIKGVKYACDPNIYLKYEAQIAKNLNWLHCHLGKNVFKRIIPPPASAPRWSETTVQSILTLVGRIAKDLQAKEPPTVARLRRLPDELAWLRNAPAAPADFEGAPRFNEVAIRSLALLIHEMAFALEQAQKREIARAKLDSTASGLVRRLFGGKRSSMSQEE